MNHIQGSLLYEGKAKRVFASENSNRVLIEFKNDATAFNAKKRSEIEGKGRLNCKISAALFKLLQVNGIPTHFLELHSETFMIAEKIKVIPLEVVIRNIATGSLCRRLGVEEGIKFEEPLFEFFLKDDELGDPLINDNHITAFGWGTEKEIVEMKEITFKINSLLCKLFREVGLILVDYKVEYGRSGDVLILGDEFTPDGCRIWDAETGESLDKDRFRKDLGDVVESYQIVAHKLGITL